jgi:hypothetical protein
MLKVWCDGRRLFFVWESIECSVQAGLEGRWKTTGVWYCTGLVARKEDSALSLGPTCCPKRKVMVTMSDNIEMRMWG